jgi:hypothetical protein
VRLGGSISEDKYQFVSSAEIVESTSPGLLRAATGQARILPAIFPKP